MLFTCVCEGHHESHQHQEDGSADLVAVIHGDRDTGRRLSGNSSSGDF